MKKGLIIISILILSLISGIYIYDMDKANIRSLTLSQNECKGGEEVLVTFTYDSTWQDSDKYYFGNHKFYSVFNGEEKLLFETEKLNLNDDLHTHYFKINVPNESGDYEIKIKEKVHIKDRYTGDVRWLEDVSKSTTLTVLEKPDIVINSNVGNVDLIDEDGNEYVVDLTKSKIIKDVDFKKKQFTASKLGYQDNQFEIDTTEGENEVYNLEMKEKTINPSLTLVAKTPNIKVLCEENNEIYNVDDELKIEDLENWEKYNFVASKEGYKDKEFVGIPSDGGNTLSISLEKLPIFTIYTPDIDKEVNLKCSNDKLYTIPANESSIEIRDLNVGEKYFFNVDIEGYYTEDFSIEMPDNPMTYNLIPSNNNDIEDEKLETETNQRQIKLYVLDKNGNEINDAIVYINEKGKSTSVQPLNFVVNKGDVDVKITHPDMIDLNSTYNIENNTEINLTLLNGNDVSNIININDKDDFTFKNFDSIIEKINKEIIGIIFIIIVGLGIYKKKK